MKKIIANPGEKFGRLTVVGLDHKNAHSEQFWLMSCDCGNQKVIVARSVLTGATKSCGCIAVERASVMNLKHGLTKSATYQSWQSMKKRCYSKTAREYKDYGGRGIYVCRQWVESFEQFLVDMGECPAGHTLERLDVNKHYEPSNCKWATRKEQSRNRRVNKLTAETAVEIRALYKTGRSYQAIAEQFSVSKSLVAQIVRGELWA